jgi:hypothetical protein
MSVTLRGIEASSYGVRTPFVRAWGLKVKGHQLKPSVCRLGVRAGDRSPDPLPNSPILCSIFGSEHRQCDYVVIGPTFAKMEVVMGDSIRAGAGAIVTNRSMILNSALDRKTIDRLRSLRGPGESYSDVILLLAKAAS